MGLGTINSSPHIPVRRDNSEAMAHRREFKEAMRRRIRDVPHPAVFPMRRSSPALTLKQKEIARFSKKHGVSFGWLLEGKGHIYRGGGCELMDILNGD
jgi:hypothetical protein